jgi:hypothetical protein
MIEKKGGWKKAHMMIARKGEREGEFLASSFK